MHHAIEPMETSTDISAVDLKNQMSLSILLQSELPSLQFAVADSTTADSTTLLNNEGEYIIHAVNALVIQSKYENNGS
jgi:phosphatidate phosphatase APP1